MDFITACNNDDIEEVKKQLAGGFFRACAEGNLDIVKLLATVVDKETINTGFADEACRTGELKIVEFLYYKVKDPAYGLSEARDHENGDIVDFIIERGPGKDFYSACKSGDMTCIEAYKLDDYDNELVMEVACRNGHLEVVKYLVEKLDMFDLENINICYYYACAYGHLEVVKYLDECSKTYGNTLDQKLGLSGALASGKLDVVKYLTYKVDDNHLMKTLIY